MLFLLHWEQNYIPGSVFSCCVICDPATAAPPAASVPRSNNDMPCLTLLRISSDMGIMSISFRSFSSTPYTCLGQPENNDVRHPKLCLQEAAGAQS